MNKKKFPVKILFVLPGLEVGGAERVLINLMNGINRQKYDPVFLVVRGDGPLRELINPNITLISLGQNLSLASLPSLHRQIKKINPEIIISTMTLMNFAILSLKPFFPNINLVVREAITPSYFFQKYKLRSFIVKLLYKFLYSKAQLILSPTEKIFDELDDVFLLDREKCIVLKNSVNVKKIRSEIKLIDSPPETKKIIKFIACGRLIKQKGFDRLINELEYFNPSFDWKINILGEGHEKTALEKLINKKSLQDKVFLKGLIMPPYTYLANADCFLLPSRFEGLPNVVLESLACGTPVIAINEAGGINEIEKECLNGDVKVVRNMKDFLNEMEKVEVLPKSQIRESLLANCYYQDKVFKNFECILDKISK